MRALLSARFAALAAAVVVAGCGSVPMAGTSAPACSSGGVERAEYVGPYLGVENLVGPADFARDLHCAEQVKARLFPGGYVTIFGSSRLGPDDAVYGDVRRFAAVWTARHARAYPVMTGAGPGLMEAGNRGAKEAGGPSVGYTTYYDRAAQPTPQRPYGGDPRQALNAHVTHGLVFSSVVAREAAMIVHSAAIVIAPGGTGTEWETFQVIETIKSRQVLPVPVYLFGDRSHWATLRARLDDMVQRRVIRREEIAFLRSAATPEELVEALRADLKLQ